VELQVICPTTRREINNVGRRREGGGGNVANTRHKGGDSGKMAKMVKSTGLERKFAHFTIVWLRHRMLEYLQLEHGSPPLPHERVVYLS
jgi:hypothetical protein